MLSTVYINQKKNKKSFPSQVIASDPDDIPVQLLSIRFMQHAEGMNYRLVATVTHLVQKNTPPVEKKKKRRFGGLIFEKAVPAMGGGGGERKKKARERRGTRRQGLTGGDWQPGFARFGSRLPLCLCEGEQKRLICHSFRFHSHTCTSFAFCPFYLVLPPFFLRMPPHFLNDNAAAISNGPGHGVACIQSCERGKVFVPNVRIFLQPFTHGPTCPLRFPPATYPPSIS